MTAIVNKSTFMANDQDLKSSSDAFTAAYEQPLLSLCLLVIVCSLEGSLLWLMRASSNQLFDSHAKSQADQKRNAEAERTVPPSQRELLSNLNSNLNPSTNTNLNSNSRQGGNGNAANSQEGDAAVQQPDLNDSNDSNSGAKQAALHVDLDVGEYQLQGPSGVSLPSGSQLIHFSFSPCLLLLSLKRNQL